MNAAVITWCAPPETLVLGGDEVHVWRATLDQTPLQIQSFLDSLTADEQARADRFYFEKDREHFIVARGVLRAILGGYLNRVPESLSFSYSAHGKPFLAGDTIRFNMSHSHGIALYAVTRGREVGIDIERIRVDVEVAEIAERFFSCRGAAMLRALSAEVQREAFFNCWTRKEAYIKARGEGLSLPLDQFDVALAPGEPAALLDTRPDASEAARWSLRELPPTPNYVAALAVAGHGWRFTCWQWPSLGLDAAIAPTPVAASDHPTAGGNR